MTDWLADATDAEIAELARRLGVTENAIRNGDEASRMDAASELAVIRSEQRACQDQASITWAEGDIDRAGS